MDMKMKYADGGEVDNQRSREIAQAILQQLGGGNRLIMMVGAYNFVIIPNGVAFRIKNAKANVIKITLNALDLYNLEVGRVRGTTYKVVAKHDNIYNDMLKPLIEKSTGMYLSLYEKGGNIETEVDALYNKSQLINANENWKIKLLEMLQDGSSEAYNIYERLNAKQKAEVLQEQFEMDNDMGSYGDGKKSTSKENLMALLDDAKNGKRYDKGGAMKNKMAKGGKTESKSVAVSKTISGNEINLFIDYCYGFYGKGGTYADELNGGLTKAQVKTAVMKYLDQLDSNPTWGGGDSLDRERVRLIFDKNYSLLKKGGKMAKGGGVGKLTALQKKVYESIKNTYSKSLTTYNLPSDTRRILEDLYYMDLLNRKYINGTQEAEYTLNDTIEDRYARLTKKEAKRLDELQKKENDGSLTKSENDEYEKLVYKYRGWENKKAKGGSVSSSSGFNYTIGGL